VHCILHRVCNDYNTHIMQQIEHTMQNNLFVHVMLILCIGTVCSIAGSLPVRRQAVIRRAGSAGHLPDRYSVLGCWERDDLPGLGWSSGPDLLGATRRAQCTCSLGARRLVGQIPASASRVSAAGAVRRLARDWARPTLSLNVVGGKTNFFPISDFLFSDFFV
jgi:hypothetical protein